MLKSPLSIDQQIATLNSRGMIITDIKNLKDFISKNNYYRLNYFFHKYMDENNKFLPNTNSEQVIAAYKNDHWLRSNISFILCPIEIHVKTCLAHHLAMTYGADCFYNNHLFVNQYYYNKLRELFDKEIEKKKKSPVVVHHMSTYGGLFPIWVVIEYLTFGAISNFYQNLQTPDRRAIGRMVFNIDEYYLKNWLHTLNLLRNLCAHHGHLYKRSFSQPPKLMKSFGWDKSQNNMLFAQFLVMKRVSDPDLWQEFIDALDSRRKRNPEFDLADYGFPSDWEKFLK